MKMKRNNTEGITLIELLVVVAIIGILVAIAVPVYTGYIRAAKRSEAKTNLQQLRLLLEQYYSENGSYCPGGDCSGSPFDYQENDDGSVKIDEITTYSGTDYLVGFKPKSAASGTAVLYNYSIAVNGNSYTITASPVAGRGAPAGNLTIDQDGNKTGAW